jgi:thiamine-monophosphate kinase
MQYAPMKIGDLGEFGLIERITRLLPEAPRDVVLGIGDDVAVLDTSGPNYLLATCDIQVEDVHFRRDIITPRQLGQKVIAINVSDIAAMGGRPRWALVSLGLPGDTSVEFVDELYRGMAEQSQAARMAIVGGNLSKIDGPVVIDLFLLGECAKDRFLCRNAAEVGDALLVTGTLGDSRAGLELLQRPDLEVTKPTHDALLAAHLTPQPRLQEGQLLADSGLIHAMLDVSDGTLGDLRHICEASRVGAAVELIRLPISPACREAAAAAGVSPEDWALGGGEDYQLMFTVAQHNVARVQSLLSDSTGTRAQVIGQVLPATLGISVISPDGSRHPHSEAGGWDHFRRGRQA